MNNFFNSIAQSFRGSIRNQLSGITIGMALIPALIVSIFIGALTISRIQSTLQANALSQLEQVRTIKSEQLATYFRERTGNTIVNSQTQTMLAALTDITQGGHEIDPSTMRSLYLGKPDLIDAGDASAYTAAHRQYSQYLSNLVKTFGFYDLFIITQNGQVIYTYAKEDDFGTDLLNGKYADSNLAKAFQAALKLEKGQTTISDFEFYAPSANAPAAFIAAPIVDSGRVVGVLAFQLPLDKITAIMQEHTGLGDTGETYLVGHDLLFRSESRFQANSLLNLKVDTLASNSALAGNSGSALIEDYRGTPVFSSWQPIQVGDLQWAFIAEIDQTEALASANQLTTFIITSISIAGLIVTVLAFIVAFSISRSFTEPILELRNFASEAASGKLDVTIKSNRADELGVLARTFNFMTSQLKTTLETVDRRAAELATVAEVSTATATILETRHLLQEVVDLTKERFNLYHSHIYLLDEAGENLVLASGAGEPGRVMTTEGRSIPLNREQSLVARAARERQGVIVNDVTQAPDFLPNPLLPDTRSELAVPMIIGGNVLGVFDIQSEQVGRFTASDINIQATLAAQLATSIQNVRSFEQSKKQAELESMVNTIGQKIQNATSIEETLQTAIRELGMTLGAARVQARIAPRQNSETIGN